MHQPAIEAEEIDQVYELNRLFLHFLRDQARRAGNCLGLPQACVPRIAGATMAQLDAVANLPRALFVLELADAATGEAFSAGSTAAARARQSLQLTIVLSLWHVCRQSAFKARSIFGLSSDAIRCLRGFALSELPGIAASSRLVACGFADSGWLWSELLADCDPTQRERLRLIALQPRLGDAHAQAREAPRYE
jgi:hypothetical protein